MKRYLLTGLVCLGFVGSASAQDPADVTTILENLQPALEDLAAGLENTATTLAETQSAVETSAALGDTVVTTGSTLVDEAPTLGDLGVGLTLINSSAQDSAEPFLLLIDDPSAETLEDVFNPDDLSTIAGNLEEVPDAAVFGSPFAFNTGLRDAAVELLRGNLMDDDALPIGPSAATSALYGVASATDALVDGSNYGNGGAGVNGTVAITSLVLLSAAQSPLLQAEDGAAPVFEGAAPATEPLIEALEGL